MIPLPRGRARSVRGARALVTGGAKGIGAVLSVALARQEAQVLAASRDELAHARFSSACAERGLELRTARLDLRREGSIRALAEHAVDALGGLDVIVHNAALPVAGPLDGLEPDATAQAFDVALRGPLQLTRALLPALRASDRATLVFVSSLAARFPMADTAVYGAAKRAVEAAAEALHEELRDDGIRVSVISPSFVGAPSWPEARGRFDAQASLDPWDVADALLYVLRCRPSVCPLRVELRTSRDPWLSVPDEAAAWADGPGGAGDARGGGA